MRKLTLLSFALGAAACGSEDRCDPFLEAMDCVHGQTPVGVHRYGTPQPQGEASTVSPSSQIGPTAGSANGPGPSPGSANGPGPSPGPLGGTGPTAGSAQGPGPSAGSANPADSLFVSEGPELACASFCEGLYTACGQLVSAYAELSVSQLISACTSSCDCLQRAAPACMEAFFGAFGPCIERGSCDAIGACIDTIEETVPEPAACETLETSGDACGKGLFF